MNKNLNKILFFGLIVIGLISFSHRALAANYYWVGASGANTSSASSWSATSGGAGGAGVPSTGDNIYFTSLGNTNANIDSNLSVASITVGPSYTRTITQTAASVTTSGNFVMNSGTYTHAANSTTETYKATINIGGAFTLASGATITANGKGFVGRYGAGTCSGTTGASYGGMGGETNGNPSLITYGSITAPTNIGSDCTYGNGAGGAIIMTVSGLSTINGTISANGTNGAYGDGGSGGSVYLTTATISGSTGSITSNGGGSSTGKGGGGGRISVILTQAGAGFSGYTGSITAYGGNTSYPGAAGTIYKQTGSQSSGTGSLIINNNSVATFNIGTATVMNGTVSLSSFSQITVTGRGNLGVDTGETLVLGTNNITTDSTASITVFSGANVTFPASLTLGTYNLVFYSQALSASSNIIIPNGATLTLATTQFTVTGNVTVQSGGLITHAIQSNLVSGSTELYKVNLVINGNLTIDSGGSINVNSRGFQGNYNIGPGGGASCSGNNGGASHGGMAYCTGNATGNAVYGSLTAPTNYGSAVNAYGGPGGGAISLTVSGLTTINGTISATGAASGYGYGGSGGSIYLTTATISGSTGVVSVNGASSAYSGAGGRISLILTQAGADFSGYTGSITAYGGSGTYSAAAGTIYKQTGSQSSGQGDIIINTNVSGIPSGIYTKLNSSWTPHTLYVTGYATFNYPSGVNTLTFSSSNLNYTIVGSSTASIVLGQNLTVPGSTAFTGSVSASGITTTYSGFSNSTTVDILPGTHNILTFSKTGITYRLSGNVSVLTSFTIPCNVTLDLNGANWQGTLDSSTNSGCGATLVYHGGSINGVGESGTSVTTCSGTGSIGAGTYANYSIIGSDTVCTLTGNVIVTSNISISGGATLHLAGYALKAASLSIGSGSTLRLVGSENLYLSSVTNNGIVQYVGSNNSNTDNYLLKDFSYKDLQVALTDPHDILLGTYVTNLNSLLLGYWKLDESSTPAVDSSLYGNNGTWTGSPSTDTSGGMSSSIKFYNPRHMIFNGTSQYVNLGNPANLNVSSPITFTAWIKRAATGGTRDILGHGTGSYVFFIDSNNKLSLSKRGGTAVTSVSTITDTTYWHHVAVSYDGSTAKFYIDGALNASPAFSQVFSAANNLYIGADPSSGEYFNGRLDEVRIYNRILTAAEIATLAAGYPNEGTPSSSLTASGSYTHSSGSTLFPAVTNFSGSLTQSGGVVIGGTTLNTGSDFTLSGGLFSPGTTFGVNGNFTQSGDTIFARNQSLLSLTQNGGTQIISSTSTFNANTGLSAYWKLDDVSSPAVDSGGSNYNGTWVNSPITTTGVAPALSSWSPRAITLNGSNQYISTSASAGNFNYNNAFSVSAWIKTAAASYGPITSKWNISVTKGWYLSSYGSQFDFELSAEVGGSYSYALRALTLNPFNDNQWHHVVATYDGSGSANGMRVYLDGISQVLSVVANGNITGGITNNVPLVIGTRFISNSASNFFNGSIDDVRIYNRVLSPAEVFALAKGVTSTNDTNTFYGLSKIVTSASVLKLLATNPVTIMSTTTLKGTAAAKLTVQSTSNSIATPATDQWKFDPRGGLDLAYLNVQNSNNINGSTTALYPIINAGNYPGITDSGGNTNWTFVAPVLTLEATGTQSYSTNFPVTDNYLGGAFVATTTATTTITGISLTQAGSLATSNFSNVKIYYKESLTSVCDTSSFPTGTTLFGTATTWSGNKISFTGSMIVGNIHPTCIYIKYSLAGTFSASLVFNTVDLQIASPSIDIVSAGNTINPSSAVNINGSTIIVDADDGKPGISISVASSSIAYGNSTVLNWSVTNNPSTCVASGEWSGTKASSGSNVSTGILSTHKTFIYYLACQNTLGWATSSASVIVTDPRAPTVTISASPSIINSGESSTVNWSTTKGSVNANTDCHSIGTWNDLIIAGQSGSKVESHIVDNSYYGISCSNVYGTTQKVATVTLRGETLPDHCQNGQMDEDYGETGVDIGGVCSDSGSSIGAPYGDFIILQMPDSSINPTVFYLYNDGRSNALYMRQGPEDSNPTVKKLTDDNVDIVNGRFIKLDCDGNDCAGVKIELTLRKKSLTGSNTENFTVEKFFQTTSRVRKNR